MREWKNEFNGVFESDCQENSVPVQLLTTISMLIDNNDLTGQRFSQGALTCAQIIMYNFKKVYHKQYRETPIVLYNSLKIYASLRSETLIERLFSLGICVPYKRVLELTKDISHSLLKQFEIRKVFLPTSSKVNLFTVIAKDNIDLNASSSTASSHYYGTCMSLLQFPDDENTGSPICYNYEKSVNISLKVTHRIC